jgi:hypothetical protein
MQTSCQLSQPQLFDGSTPSSTDQIFNFAKMDCTSTDETLALIENDNENQFYLSQTISYGDFLVLAFLILFLVLGITKFLLGWFIPKHLDWKQH